MTQPASSENPSNSIIWVRQSRVLNAMPIEYRWEFTRRHPTYLSCWQKAHQFYLRTNPDPLEQKLAEAAMMMLLQLGVSTDPPPPFTSPEALQIGELGQKWEAGAIAPATYRDMAGELLMNLPSEARRLVGQILIESAEIPERQNDRLFDLMLRLMVLPEPSLDEVSKRPTVGINMQVPQRAIVAALEELIRDWKKEQQIDEIRRHESALKDYLRVWDLREGWVDNHYEIDRERTFQQIADQLSVPRRTAASRYYSAFRLICGHEHSFDNWVMLFSVVKLAIPGGARSLRRRKSVVPKRESDAGGDELVNPVASNGGHLGIGDRRISTHDASEVLDIITDVRELIKKGWSDEQIIDEMEFEQKEPAEKLIQTLRRHRDDPSS